MNDSISPLAGDNPPLVTVGIPTFNRPVGLRRTLNCICNQSYAKLDIVVSDNCSTDIAVAEVLSEFSEKDSRIRVISQSSNCGAFHNFKTVLEVANGEFFMWAADDDEWQSDFIESCLQHIVDHTGICTGITIYYRVRDEYVRYPYPELPTGKYAQALAYLKNPNASLIYSLHRTRDVRWFCDEHVPPFDWFDCYFVLANILRGRGYKILVDKTGYTSGVDTDEYVFKPMRPSEKKRFEYWPILKMAFVLIRTAPSISFRQRVSLVLQLTSTWAKLYLVHEQSRPAYVVTKHLIRWHIAFCDFMPKVLGVCPKKAWP